jgi:hypothetical protein
MNGGLILGKAGEDRATAAALARLFWAQSRGRVKIVPAVTPAVAFRKFRLDEPAGLFGDSLIVRSC